jgi:hypothetical protein
METCGPFLFLVLEFNTSIFVFHTYLDMKQFLKNIHETLLFLAIHEIFSHQRISRKDLHANAYST